LKSKLVKRLLAIVGFFAAVNLLAIIGLLVFLFGTGKLNRERVASIVEVVRGQSPAAGVAASQPTSQPVGLDASQKRIARDDVQEEVVRRRTDRAMKELQDQDSLLRTLMMDLVAKEESVKEREKALAEARLQLKNQKQDLGFKKTLELLSGIKPDSAKELLRAGKEPDAVRYLLEMNLEVGKKIIDKCTSAEDRQWIGRILDQIREHNLPRAEALAAGNSTKR
jgi:hypothetical protein